MNFIDLPLGSMLVSSIARTTSAMDYARTLRWSSDLGVINLIEGFELKACTQPEF